MFRTSILKAAAVTAISVSVASIGAGAAMAGSYGGYGSNHGNGYGNSAQYRAPTPVKQRIWKQHVAWCQDRFATYNAYDNTYQPYSGRRRQCRSPYYS